MPLGLVLIWFGLGFFCSGIKIALDCRYSLVNAGQVILLVLA